PAGAVDLVPADLDQGAADGRAGNDLARDRPRGDARRRLARAGPAATAIVADAVFLPVGIVGVAGPELVGDVGIVAAALVDVVDDDADGRAGGQLPTLLVGENARQHPGRVGLAALCRKARLAGAPAVETDLDGLCGKLDARRAAIDDAAERWAVALTPSRDPKQVPERVVGHGAGVPSGARAVIAQGGGRAQRGGLRTEPLPGSGWREARAAPAPAEPVAGAGPDRGSIADVKEQGRRGRPLPGARTE